MFGVRNQGNRPRSPCSRCTTPSASQRWSSVYTNRTFGRLAAGSAPRPAAGRARARIRLRHDRVRSRRVRWERSMIRPRKKRGGRGRPAPSGRGGSRPPGLVEPTPQAGDDLGLARVGGEVVPLAGVILVIVELG